MVRGPFATLALNFCNQAFDGTQSAEVGIVMALAAGLDGSVEQRDDAHKTLAELRRDIAVIRTAMRDEGLTATAELLTPLLGKISRAIARAEAAAKITVSGVSGHA